MTNPTPHGQVPEALRLAALLLNLQTHMGPRRPSHPDDAHCWDGYTQSSAELRRLHAENEALRAAHVQNPAENEHVAGDVSKNGAEVNTNVYAELPPNVGEYKYGGGLYTDAQMRVFADATHALRTQQPAPAAINLNCKSEQKRLATLWGFVPAPDYKAGWKDGYKQGAWPTQQPASRQASKQGANHD